MNWYKKANTKFPFDLDKIWEELNELDINTNPPLPRKIGTINDTIDDLDIYLVDGDEIKKKYFMDFVEGGNNQVYKFVPKNQLWVDDNMNPKVIPHIIYHEFIEQYLMKCKDMSYDDAHDIANKNEKKRIK